MFVAVRTGRDGSPVDARAWLTHLIQPYLLGHDLSRLVNRLSPLDSDPESLDDLGEISPFAGRRGNCVAEPVTQVSKCRAGVRLLAVSKRDGQGSPTPSDQAYRKLATVDRHNSGSRPMQRATTVGDHSWDRPELGLGSQWRTRGATICLALMTEWLPLHSPLAVDTPHWNRTARHGVEFDRGPPGGPSAVECERGGLRSVHLIRHD